MTKVLLTGKLSLHPQGEAITNDSTGGSGFIAGMLCFWER